MGTNGIRAKRLCVSLLALFISILYGEIFAQHSVPVTAQEAAADTVRYPAPDSALMRKFDLDGVVVTATRTPKRLMQTPVITQVVRASQIAKRGVSDIRNLLTQEIPGLMFNEVGFGTSINLQGLGGKHILFLVDGERMAGETGNNIDYQRLNLHNVERIEIVQGASSALYGSQAMGGVINIITKRQTQPFSASANVKWSPLYERNYRNISKTDGQKFFKKSVDRQNLNADLLLGARWRTLTLQAQATYKSADAYKLYDTDSVVKVFDAYGITIREPRNTIPTQISGYASQSYGLSVGYKPSERLSVSAKGAYYLLDKFDLTPDNKYEHNNDLNGTLSATYNITDNQQLQATFYTDDYSRFTHLEKLGENRLIYRNRLVQPRLLYTLGSWHGQTITAGADYLYENLYTDKFVAGRYTSKNQQSASLFAQDDWEIIPSLSLVGGVRVDYHNVYGANVAPKLALVYRIFPFTLRFNYAAGYRSPNLKELYMDWDHLGMFWIYGNSALKPERNHYFSLSAEYVSTYLYAVATGYLNQFSDKIEGIWAKNQTELHYRNISNSLLAGGYASVRLNPWVKNLFLHLSANYLFPSKSNGVQLTAGSRISGTGRVEYGYGFGEHFISLNVSTSVLGGKRYHVQDMILVNGTTVEAYYLSVIPTYALWNASLAYQYAAYATLTVGIDNLLNYRAPIVNFNSYSGPGRSLFVSLNVQI